MTMSSTASSPSLAQALGRCHDQHGQSLAQRSSNQPLMIVFLRHLGCTFCLQTLQDLRAQREAIQDAGIQPVLVHMSDDASAQKRFAPYGLDDLPRVSDPDQDLYRAFQLRRGSLWQLFGPKVVLAGLAALARGNTVGKLQGDGFQMPGVFIVHNGKIVKHYRHATAGDRPKYDQMACSTPPVEPTEREPE